MRSADLLVPVSCCSYWKRKTGQINKMEDEKESKDFKIWLEKLCDSFFRLTDTQKNTTMEQLIKLCGPDQLRFLSTKLEVLVKRDFLKCLPLELCFHVLKWMEPSSLCRCCLVSKKWEKVISNCHQVWQKACMCLGMDVNEHNVPKERWKDIYLRAMRKIHSFKKDSSYETTMLHGHTARVFALCYKYGMLATGSDDRSVRLWDPQTGHCEYVLLTHTCADISFDMNKVVTASFDNTIGMWDWKTGHRLQCYQGHTGAVFCVDYSDELDIIVSGSADTTVKVWSMSSGGCQVTRYGHSDWVIKVILYRSKVNSPTHKIGEFVLLSMDKKTIKIWSLDVTISTPLATLPTQDENIHLQPRVQFDGNSIVCASDAGIHSWNFETLELSRSFVSSPSKWLVAKGHMFSLLLDSTSLHLMNNRSEHCIASRELPPFRRSARGSNFTSGDPVWLNCLCENIRDNVLFATSMPDHSILVLKFKDHT